MWAVLCLCVVVSSVVLAAPRPQDAAAKSAFIPAFDEIVVESTLTVKGRSSPTSPGQRQGRTKLLVVPTPGTPLATDTASNSTSTSTSTSTTTSTSTPAVSIVSSGSDAKVEALRA